MDRLLNEQESILELAREKLGGQAYKLFMLLYENRVTGTFVSSDDIIKSLWGGGNVYARENGIAQCIKQIREALGKEKVENKRGCGYRLALGSFAGDVQILTTRQLMRKGFTAQMISSMIMRNDKNLYDLPKEVAGTEELWAKMYAANPDLSIFVLDEGLRNIVGNFSLCFLSETDERLMRQGKLRDCDLAVQYEDERKNQALYLLNISVNEGIPNQYYEKLWEELANTIKEKAKAGVFYKAIYYKAFTPNHGLYAFGRGFTVVSEDAKFENHDYKGVVYMLDLQSHVSLKQFDEDVAELYKAKATEQEIYEKVNDRITQIYYELTGRIISLFNKKDCAPLESYFTGSRTDKLPASKAEVSRGLAIAWFLRDVYQYSECFLPYLTDSVKRTHICQKEKIMGSALVRRSMEQYRFGTEHTNTHKMLEIDPVMPEAVWLFAKIWIDLDYLFLDPELWEIKPFYYEKANELPEEGEQRDLAMAFTVRVLTAMKISQDLWNDAVFGKLPRAYIDSYLEYREKMMKSKLVEETMERYSWLRAEKFISQKGHHL